MTHRILCTLIFSGVGLAAVTPHAIAGDFDMTVFQTNPGPNGFFGSPYEIDGALYLGLIGPNGGEPYIFDENGLREITDQNGDPLDLLPGPSGSNASSFRPVGDHIAFVANSGNGREFFTLRDGVVTEYDIQPGAAESRPFSLTTVGDKMYFSAEGPDGRELHVFDGAGVRQVADINSNGDGRPNGFQELDGLVYFHGTGNNGSALFTLDPSTEQVVEFADLYDGNDEPSFFEFNRYHDFIAFRSEGDNGEELFVLDDGIVTEYNIGGTSGSRPMRLTAFGDDKLIFGASGNDAQTHIYDHSEGTVTPLDGPGGIDLSSFSFTPYKDGVVFEANNEFAYFDGTELTLLDLNPTGDSHPDTFLQFGDDIYFTARDEGVNTELWRFDGSSAERVTELVPGVDGSGARPAFVFEDTLFVQGWTPDGGRELYYLKDDELVLVEDLVPGAAGLDPRNFVVSETLGVVGFYVQGSNDFQFNFGIIEPAGLNESLPVPAPAAALWLLPAAIIAARRL